MRPGGENTARGPNETSCLPQTMRKQPWFERQFPTGLPAELFPVVVERLRGTPARLEERLQTLPPTALTRRSGSTWSIQENAGHLLDLEPLWRQPGGELLARHDGVTP